MKSKAVCILVVILIAAFAASFGWAADEAKIVVMNPRGIQPEIRKIPMATRPATLDGKTVYIVDTKYPNTKPFVDELFAALKAKYPKTTWVLREKLAGYMDDDPNLWKEIKEKGCGSHRSGGALKQLLAGGRRPCSDAWKEWAVPAVPMITQRFKELVTTISYKKGIPNMRITYTPHPDHGQTGGSVPEICGGQ